MKTTSPFGFPDDPPVLPVNQAVMEPAQGDQIVEIGGTLVRPMNDVMGMGPAGPATPREPTAPVTTLHQAAQPGRDLAARTAHANREPGRVIDRRLQT